MVPLKISNTLIGLSFETKERCRLCDELFIIRVKISEIKLIVGHHRLYHLCIFLVAVQQSASAPRSNWLVHNSVSHGKLFLLTRHNPYDYA